MCGNVFPLEIASPSLNASAMQKLSLAYLSLKIGSCCKTLHIVLSPTSLPYYFSVRVCVYVCVMCVRSTFSHPVVLCHQFRGRNRLSPCSHNQFVSAQQLFSLEVPMLEGHLVFTK